MKKLLLFFISLLIGLGLFIWIGRIVGWQEIKNAFLVFTGWQGIVILTLTVLTALVGNWKWQEILKGEEITIPFKSLFRPYLVGFSIMFLAPILLWGGEILRGYLLKKESLIPWTKGMASVVIERILEWTINLLFIFFGILIFFLIIGLPPMKLAVIFGGIFLFFITAIFFFYSKIFRKESLASFFLRALGLKNLNEDSAVLKTEREIFDFFKLKKKAMWKAFGLSFLKAGIMYLRTWLLISFLGREISIFPALSILGFTYLAAIIPIPAALGSHEAIQTFGFNALGLGTSTAAAFTMIIRGAELILSLVGAVLLFQLGTSLLKKTLLEKINNFTDKENDKH